MSEDGPIMAVKCTKLQKQKFQSIWKNKYQACSQTIRNQSILECHSKKMLGQNKQTNKKLHKGWEPENSVTSKLHT